MLRNREIGYYFALMLLISIIGTIIFWLQSPILGVVALLFFGLLLVCSLIFTRWRYRELEKLSGHLRAISSGNYQLDLRDNHEGELSILKTEIYKVTLMLTKYSELLQNEKEQLSNTLFDISHQLKTPLTSMMVMADLLCYADLSQEKRAEFTKNLESQFQRMEWLLTSLLKLSKIDAGTVVLKKEPILVSELIQKAIKPLLIPMELKQQKLELEGDLTITFLGDMNWTTEALINILKNSIEHTQNEGILTIIVQDNPLYTEICIKDNGCGIDKADLPYIFKRFYRGKNANEDSVGIGLAMARSIIRNQNGDVSVISQKNQGTQFSVKFYKQSN